MFVEHGIDIVSNQVQFSIVDRRPETEMIPYCKDHKVFLLTYGTLCGGFLTDRYLGKPEPKASDLNTPSLRKYFNMIKRWGSWKLFQELLSELRSIADRHKEGDFSIANVAMKYILDKPAVACVLVGARLLYAEHMKENEKAFSLTLEQQGILYSSFPPPFFFCILMLFCKIWTQLKRFVQNPMICLKKSGTVEMNIDKSKFLLIFNQVAQIFHKRVIEGWEISFKQWTES